MATEIQKTNLVQLEELLTQSERRIAKVLPRHLKADRMIAVTMELVSGDSLLSRCEPASVLEAVLEASQLGLLLNKKLGHGYLVPFKNGKLSKKYDRELFQATFMIGYRGFIDLVLRDGQASSVHSCIVFPGERFEMYEGTRHELIHQPNPGGGEPYKPTGKKIPVGDVKVDELEPTYLGAYSVVIYSGAGRPADFTWMPMKDIERIRRSSKAQGLDSPWRTWPDQMILKTPIRRLCKRLKLTADVLTATVRDEDRELRGVLPEEAEGSIYDITPEVITEPRRKSENGQAPASETEQAANRVKTAVCRASGDPRWLKSSPQFAMAAKPLKI